MNDKDVRIGVVITPEETEDDTVHITARGTIAIYFMMMFPIGLLAYALSRQRQWSTEGSILFFSIVLSLFTLVYVFSTMGTLTRIVRNILRFIVNMYTIRKQAEAYKQFLDADAMNRSIEYARQISHIEPRALLEEKVIPMESQVQAELLKYVTWLYATQDGVYLHINADGRIKNAVPWSARKGQLDADMVERIIRMISWKHGRPLIYYHKNGWYLNVESYPYHDEVVRAFNQLTVGQLNKEAYRNEY